MESATAAGPDQHRRSPDRGGQERTSRNLGCPMDEGSAGLGESAATPTSQGSKTSEAERFAGVQPGFTMLAEHQDLTDVYCRPRLNRVTSVPGLLSTVHAVSCERSHCRPRGLPRTLAGVSVCDTRKRRSSPPPRWVAESPRCEAELAKRTAPFSHDEDNWVVC